MTSLAVPEFQDTLGALSGRAGRSAEVMLARLERLSMREQLQVVTDVYPKLMQPFLSAAGELTAQWYAEQPKPLKPGAAVFVPEPAPLMDPERLEISARWAVLQNDPVSALRGSSLRSVFDQSRATVLDNVKREGVRWGRYASFTACGFCRMLATRGAVYWSEENALASHDCCRCLATPCRDGNWDPPAYVEEWRDAYEKAHEEFGSDPNAIARALDEPELRPRRTPEQREELQAEYQGLVEKLNEPVPVNLDPPAKSDDDFAAWVRGESLDGLDAKEMPLSKLDAVLAEAEAALAAGDAEKAGELFDRAFAIEEAEKAKEAARAAADEVKQDRVLQLIEEGWNPVEAEAEVYNVEPEKIRRRDFIAQARNDGHVGSGFDELLKSVHAEYVAEQYWQAEADLRSAGAIRPQYAERYTWSDLWKVNDATARKIMTEEMAAWFDANGGRITRDVMREAILSGSEVFDVSMRQDFLQ